MRTKLKQSKARVARNEVDVISKRFTPDTKDALAAMSRVETSRAKQFTYRLPILHYIRCDL
jgi:hypothetical protein